MLLSGVQKRAQHLPKAATIHVLPARQIGSTEAGGDSRLKFRFLNPARGRNPKAGLEGMTIRPLGLPFWMSSSPHQQHKE
jgi:hypothetical protein